MLLAIVLETERRVFVSHAWKRNGWVIRHRSSSPLLLIVLGCGLLLLGIGIWRDVERRGDKPSNPCTSSSGPSEFSKSERSRFCDCLSPQKGGDFSFSALAFQGIPTNPPCVRPLALDDATRSRPSWVTRDGIPTWWWGRPGQPSIIGIRHRKHEGEKARSGGSAPRLQLADSGGGRTVDTGTGRWLRRSGLLEG